MVEHTTYDRPLVVSPLVMTRDSQVPVLDNRKIERALSVARLEADSFRACVLTGGFSNLNLRIDSAGGPHVLRVYRDSETVSKELQLHGLVRDKLPVPPFLYADLSGDTMGTPFAILEFVAGVTLDTVLVQADDEDIVEAGQAVGSTLAAIGSITFDRGGFLGRDLQPAGPPIERSTVLLPYVQERLFSAASEKALGPRVRNAYWEMVKSALPTIDRLQNSSSLVHGDYNPKNILMEEVRGRWQVVAVLDWEFAFSGSQLWDVGNMLRFAHEYHPCFRDAFVRSFADGGGRLPLGWTGQARTLDVANLVEFISRGPGEPFFEQTRKLVQQAVMRGSL